MELREWLTIFSIASNVLFVPLAASYWNMQKRLSRIEGILEIIVRKVH